MPVPRAFARLIRGVRRGLSIRPVRTPGNRTTRQSQAGQIFERTLDWFLKTILFLPQDGQQFSVEPRPLGPAQYLPGDHAVLEITQRVLELNQFMQVRINWYLSLRKRQFAQISPPADAAAKLMPLPRR